VEAFGEAIWAVYDLRQLWRSWAAVLQAAIPTAPSPVATALPCGGKEGASAARA
jgi:hypothetical protein